MINSNNYHEKFHIEHLTGILSTDIEKHWLVGKYKGIIVLGIGTNKE